MEIYEAQWELSPERLTAGGMGLSLYPMSLVKIAQLLLKEGSYNGSQLISKEYLKMAVKQQIIKRDDINDPDSEFRETDMVINFIWVRMDITVWMVLLVSCVYCALIKRKLSLCFPSIPKRKPCCR